MSNRAKRLSITIQQPIRTKDDNKQPIYRWENLYQGIRASYEQSPTLSDEKMTGLRKVEAIVEGVFSIRYNPRLAITTDHRIVCDGKTYGIVAVNPKERKYGEGGFKDLEMSVKGVQDA